MPLSVAPGQWAMVVNDWFSHTTRCERSAANADESQAKKEMACTGTNKNNKVTGMITDTNGTTTILVRRK